MSFFFSRLAKAKLLHHAFPLVKRDRLYFKRKIRLLYFQRLIEVPYLENSIIPTISSFFPTKEQCVCLGLGAKADYMLRLSKIVNFNISSSLTIIDLGFRREAIDNPGLTDRQARYINGFDAKLLRNQFQLNVGFRFKL